MLVGVSLAAEEAFLFARPERDANRAARLGFERGENAHDLERDDGACAVIGRAGPGDPAIEVAADHHDFIFQLGIGAGNFGNGVEAVFVVAGEFGFDVHLDRYGNVVLEQAEDAAVAFDLRDDDREGNRGVAFVRSAAHRGAVVVEDDASAAAVFAIAARDDDAGGFFLGEERQDFAGQRDALHVALDARLHVGVAVFERIGFELFECLFRRSVRRTLCRRSELRASPRAEQFCRRACPCISRGRIRR